MKKINLILGLLFFAVKVFAEDPVSLIQRIDEQRNLASMKFIVQLKSFDGEKKLDTNTLQGYTKNTNDQNKTLIWFAEPSSVKGRKMLMDGNVVYLLFPKTRNPIRLSPLQVLLGEASNGDVARTSFSRDYNPISLDTIKYNNKECWLFILKVKEKKTTYQQVKLFVEKSNLQPLYAEFYTNEEKPLKTILYKDYRLVEGKMIAFLMDVADGQNSFKHTEMIYSQINVHQLPDSAFRREYLESWIPSS